MISQVRQPASHRRNHLLQPKQPVLGPRQPLLDILQVVGRLVGLLGARQLTGGRLVVLEGSGHLALVRDPVRARALLPGEIDLAHGDVTEPATLTAAGIALRISACERSQTC